MAAGASGGWRFWLGAVVLVAGFASPALIPLVVGSALPAAWKTALSAALAFGIPELAMIMAVGIMGKAGFERVKGWLSGLLRRYGPAEQVGSVRYRVGLVLFCLPLLLGWVTPYLGSHLQLDPVWAFRVAIVSDLVLLVSFFVLGGEFWDKVRALFVHGARAVFPGGVE